MTPAPSGECFKNASTASMAANANLSARPCEVGLLGQQTIAHIFAIK